MDQFGGFGIAINPDCIFLVMAFGPFSGVTECEKMIPVPPGTFGGACRGVVANNLGIMHNEIFFLVDLNMTKRRS